MKQKLSKFIAPLMVVAVFAIVVSVATAWTGPSGSFPTGNVAAPLNTGSVDQTKSANLGVTKSLFAGDSSVAGNLVQGAKGYFLPECNGSGLFGPSMLLCYTMNATGTDIFRAFKTGTSTLGLNGQTIATFNVAKGASVNSNGDFKTGVSTLQNNVVGGTFGLTVSGTNGASSFNLPGQPLKIDITGSGASGRNAIDLRGSSDNDAVGIVQNKPKFFLFDYSANNGAGDRASLEAKNGDFSGNLRVGGGSPAAGKILASTDTNGNAAWVDAPTAAVPTVDIYEAVNTEYNDSGHVSCNPGYKVMGGGGNCGQVAATNRAILVSEPTGTGSGQEGWWINCSGSEDRTITTRAICMRITIPATTPINVGGGGGNSGGGNTLTWTTPTNVGTCTNSAFGCQGALNQSCNTWLNSVAHSTTQVQGTYNISGNVAVATTPATGTCAYKHVNPVSKDANVAINGVTTLYSSCQIHLSSYSDSNAFPVTDCTHTNATINGSTGKSVVFHTKLGN